MQTTYIFGHRNPDTDSVCSSIALSYLKNALGKKTVARTIGHLNNETKFVLKYFDVQEPQYLNDVRVRIKNIKYDKKAGVYENDSIFKAFDIMQSQNITAVPLINDAKKLTGFLSMKDISKFLISGNKEMINTTLDNILTILDAKIVTKYDDIITGNVMVVGYQSSTFHEEIKLSKNDILIIGDRFKVIDYAITSHVEMIILALDNKLSPKLIKKARENKITIIQSHLSSFQIANKIALSNFAKSICSSLNPTAIYDDDYYLEFKNLASKLNFTNYPIINHNNDCLGLLSLNWKNDYVKQQVILVDHNTYAQSIEGLDEADILEIIDHHNLGDIGTSIPINFRSMPVGSTSTIIYDMYLDNKITIPKTIAGLLLSAILSDTLLLTSPTTTNLDREAVQKLASITKINVEKYGYEMLKASSSIKDLTINQQIYQDYKSYTVGKKQIGIGQLMTMDFDEINDNMEKYITKLDEINTLNDGVIALFITDVLKKGSYVIYSKESESIIKDSFNLKEIYEGIFLKNIISRKKQIIPAIINILEK